VIASPEGRAVQYSPTLIDHFRNPRNAGMMRDPDGVGEAEYPECMDLVRFHLRVQRGRVMEARFQAYGCGPTIAAASAATEIVVGAGLGDLLELPAARIESAVGGLPAPRRHAAEVAVLGLRAAARDALSRASTRSEPDA
jgi:NifU-like protein involved in Fe-S cluster formation